MDHCNELYENFDKKVMLDLTEVKMDHGIIFIIAGVRCLFMQ